MVTLSTSNTPSAEVIGQLADNNQQVRIAASALTHMQRYRQLALSACESGGQLFGTIDASQVIIKVATGPYRRDKRLRKRYRSDPKAAQQAIDTQAANNLFYLGEWHTHAEDQPNISNMDEEAMRLLLKQSQLNSNLLFLLIVGRDTTAEGLGLWAIGAKSLTKWTLTLRTPHVSKEKCGSN